MRALGHCGADWLIVLPDRACWFVVAALVCLVLVCFLYLTSD